MARFQIIRDTLRSVNIREVVTDATGIRTINEPSSGGLSSLFSDLGSGLLKIGKGILGFFGFARLTISAIIGLLVSGVIQIWNFNWNISDDSLDSQISNLQLQIAGQLGATVGNLMGYTVCGVVPSAGLAVINKTLAYYVLQEVGQELLEELANNLRQLVRESVNLFGRWAINSVYKSSRRFIKESAKNPNSIISTYGKQIFGSKFNTIVEAWGEQSSEPWSFALAFEERIESIEQPLVREYWEEFFEEGFEACHEALFIVGNSIDQWIIQQQLERETTLGQEEAVEIVLNRDIETEPYAERIVLSGREQILRPQITNLMASYQLLESRDVGVIIGEQIQTYAKKIHSDYQIRIYWSDRKDGSKRGEVYTYTTISNVDKSKLNNWDNIKQLAGGLNGRNFGNVTVKCQCSDNSKIVVKSSSESEGIALARKLLTLTSNTITFTTKNEKVRNEGTLATAYDEEWYDPITRVYPAKLVIFNKYRILNITAPLQGSGLDSQGQYLKRQIEIPLWTESEPVEFQQLLAEILTIPSINPS